MFLKNSTKNVDDNDKIIYHILGSVPHWIGDSLRIRHQIRVRIEPHANSVADEVDEYRSKLVRRSNPIFKLRCLYLLIYL